MPIHENDIVLSSGLFAGIPSEKLPELFSLLNAAERQYAKGSYLISAGEAVSSFALLLSGAVQVFMDDIDGNHIVMANVSAGATFGEAMACCRTAESPVYAAALQDCRVLWLRSDTLLDPSFYTDPSLACFCRNFIQTVSARTLQFNDRIQVLSKKSIREKLITFFSQQIQRQKSREIVLSMDRNALADYLGVERSALSRELSRMRDCGMIDFRKNHFTIHHT